MTGQELATAMQYRAAIIVLVVNNGIYATIRMHQEREYPGRVIGTDMVNPDFVALARAHGAHAELVETTDQFAQAFDRCLAAVGVLRAARVDAPDGPRSTVEGEGLNRLGRDVGDGVVDRRALGEQGLVGVQL